MSFRGDDACVVASAGGGVVGSLIERVCAQHGHVSAALALASDRHAHALPPQVLRMVEAAGATGEEQPKEAARSGPAQWLPRRGAIRRGGCRSSAGRGAGRDRW